MFQAELGQPSSWGSWTRRIRWFLLCGVKNRRTEDVDFLAHRALLSRFSYRGGISSFSLTRLCPQAAGAVRRQLHRHGLQGTYRTSVAQYKLLLCSYVCCLRLSPRYRQVGKRRRTVHQKVFAYPLFSYQSDSISALSLIWKNSVLVTFLRFLVFLWK